MIAMREAVQGDSVEYSYQVRLIDPSYQSELMDKLHEIEDVIRREPADAAHDRGTVVARADRPLSTG